MPSQKYAKGMARVLKEKRTHEAFRKDLLSGIKYAIETGASNPETIANSLWYSLDAEWRVLPRAERQREIDEAHQKAKGNTP